MISYHKEAERFFCCSLSKPQECTGNGHGLCNLLQSWLVAAAKPPPFPPSSSHTGAGITAVQGQIPAIETLCAWNVLHGNLKILEELVFSVMSPWQHNNPAPLCCVQTDTWRIAPAGTQPSWVAFSYIHGQAPQGADLLPLPGESPSPPKESPRGAATKDGWRQDQGNRMLKQHSKHFKWAAQVHVCWHSQLFTYDNSKKKKKVFQLSANALK